jgi:hypothetical protein
VNLEDRSRPDESGSEKTIAAVNTILPNAADEGALCKRLEAGETVVINLRRDAHRSLALWAARHDLLVYIGRPGWALTALNHFLTAEHEGRVSAGPWANPYLIGRDGDRDEVIAKFENNRSEVRARARELRGFALGCWCAPEPCHGDVLKRWAEGGAR